jgi:hypothetical protein
VIPDFGVVGEVVSGPDSGSVVRGLILAFLLGLAVVGLYRASLVDRVVSPSMNLTLVLLSMVTALVMMVIGDSLARAFSLVGALAIVRFRTAIRSPLDVAFVFFALAVGIGSGVMAWRVTVLGALVVGLAVLTMGILPRARRSVHLVRIDLAAHDAREEEVHKALDGHVSGKWLEQARSLRFGETLSLWYRVTLRADRTLEGLLKELSAVEAVERVVVLAGEEGMGEGD